MITRRLRSTVLNLACSCDYNDCLQTASTKFTEWLRDPTTNLPPVNTRQLVYNFGMKRRGHDNGYWDQVWGFYLVEEDSQEKLKLMVSLAQVRDTGLLQKYLSLAEDEANVRGQDYFTVLQSISDNDIGQPIVWSYVRSEIF
jgi:ERAP1-like C-terminal domain